MKNRFSNMLASAGRTIMSYPVEMGVVLYAFVFGVLMINDVEFGYDTYIAFAPLFFALAYSLNNLIKCSGARWVYYLCWLPLIPLWFVDAEEWVESSGYVVALVCAFLAFLVCRKACDNKRFALESLGYLFDLALSFCFSGIAHLLLVAIYYSTTYIFGLDREVIPDFLEYTSLLAYMVFVPLLFLTFVHNNAWKDLSPSRIFDVLMNFILTPALLIYTVILYIYFAIIAVTWSLPKGGIAIMVFVFTMIAVLAKAWQPLLGRRYYDWFFDRFSLISLPAVSMFWIGSIYRIAEYGFTEGRFYLVLCGLIMTATLAMFACKGRGKYITVAIISMVLLSLFTFIPPISAENLSNTSQARRVEKLAGRIGLLDAEGNFSKDKRPQSDTAYREDYRKIYESLKYLHEHDRPLYGLESYSEINEIYPGEWTEIDDVRFLINDKVTILSEFNIIDISGFSNMTEPAPYRMSSEKYSYYYTSADKTLELYKKRPVNEVSDENEDAAWEQVLAAGFDEIMESSLAVAGPLPTEGLTAEFIEKQKQNPDFFTYDADDIRLVFDYIGFGEQNGEWKISDVSVGYVLIR